MIIQLVYNFYSDPGHGWLRVPLLDVQLLGFKASEYSPEYGMDIYLEEDSDAPEFVAKLREQGFEVRWTEHKIGDFEHWIPQNIRLQELEFRR